MGAHVFISFATPDQAQAEEVCRLLERRELTCWISTRNQRPGAPYDEGLIEAIERASAIVLLLSAHSNASPYVANEISCAFGKGKPIYPLRLANVPPARALEFYLARFQWTDGFPLPLDPHVDRIAAAMRQGAAAAPVAQAPAPAVAPAPEWLPSAGPDTSEHGFVMIVDDVFKIDGRGTVATGTIDQEECRVGQAVLVMTDDQRTVHRSEIEGIAFKKRMVDSGRPGDDVGLLLKGVALSEISRGMVVVGLL